MARLPRLVIGGQLHLVSQRSLMGISVFAHPIDCETYLGALREAAAANRVAVHAYGLLDNEIRLLVTPGTADSLSRMMQSVGRRFVAAYNKRHARSGTPWQGRFNATPVEAETGFLACLRFVEALPEPACASSAPHHGGSRADPLIAEHPVFWRLGNTPFEREAAYRRLSEQALSAKEAGSIEAAVRGGWPLGPNPFVTMVQAATTRRLAPLKRGRHKSVPNKTK
jgi:putative transposase